MIWVLLGILTLLAVLVYSVVWVVMEIRDDQVRLDELELLVDHRVIDEQFRRIVRES